MPTPDPNTNLPSRRRLLSLAIAAGWASPWARAFQSEEFDEAPTFSTEVNVVTLLATVRDRDGRLITDLTRQEFELEEEGRRREIRYFSAESDVPLTLGLLFDLSGSQRDVIDAQRTAARTFLDQVLQLEAATSSGDQAFLVGFNRAVQLIEAPTAAGEILEEGLGRLSIPGDSAGTLAQRAEGTALFDAIRGAASVFRRQSGRKAIVVISDGIDTASTTSRDEAIEAAQRADAIVFPIRVFDQDVFRFNISGPARDNLRRGERDLREVAEKTGGTVFDIAGETTLAEGFAQLSQELRSQYSLGFTPTGSGNGYRELRLKTTRRGLTVRTRDGYYADQ